MKRAMDSASSDAVRSELVAIDAAGRLVIPRQFRRALGIRGPQQLLVGMEGNTLRVSTTDE